MEGRGLEADERRGIGLVLGGLSAAERLLVRPGGQNATELVARLEGARSGLGRLLLEAPTQGSEAGLKEVVGEVRVLTGRLGALAENLRAFVEGYQARFCGAAGYTAEGRSPAGAFEAGRFTVEERA